MLITFQQFFPSTRFDPSFFFRISFANHDSTESLPPFYGEIFITYQILLPTCFFNHGSLRTDFTRFLCRYPLVSAYGAPFYSLYASRCVYTIDRFLHAFDPWPVESHMGDISLWEIIVIMEFSSSYWNWNNLPLYLIIIILLLSYYYLLFHLLQISIYFIYILLIIYLILFKYF